MPTVYEKLSTLLKELFQLDQADKELLPQVKSAFDQYRPADRKGMEADLQQAIIATFEETLIRKYLSEDEGKVIII